MSLRLGGITAGYGNTEVLRDVDLVVPTGRAVALLGANGAGKTTLLRACSGLLRPTRGQITIDGEDVTNLPPRAHASRGICHVPEGRAVFPGLTVAENLRLMAGRNTSESAERAAEAFPALGRHMSQTAGSLSGGEQQMLALARAYITNPRFLLLDEVSMGLAPLVVDEIFTFLERVSHQGAALLLVEQYVTKALALADLVYVLQKGVVTFAGEPCELDTEGLARSYLGDDPARLEPHPI
jgi:branched-chain amino acid transport system ATP-binding protein